VAAVPIDEVIDEILREGARHVDEVEVCCFEARSVSADLKKRQLHLATESRSTGLLIRTIDKGRIGSSSTSDPNAWKVCLDAAIASGRLATPLPWKGLPEPCRLDSSPLSFDPSLKVEPGVARDLLDRMLDGAGEHDAEVTAGSAGLSLSRSTLANTHGIRYTNVHSGASVSLEAISGQSTGYDFDHSCMLSRIDPFAVGERATFFASESADGAEIGTGVYDILLSPFAYGDLLGSVLVPALNGRSVHAGRSKLAGCLGQAVACNGISMYDDPLVPLGNGSTRWDAEGTPTRRIEYVRDGILEAFAYDLKTAYRYGKASTGNAVRGGPGGLPSIGHHNFVVDGTRSDVADERVLYIHNVVGAHTANPMSGDFSVEVSNAFWMEGGEFCMPVRSAMLSGNVFDLHKEISGLSRESRALGSMVLPSVRINKQHVVGK
jgi:PmbA protein